MTIKESINICKEMQKWRRSIEPYDKAAAELPYNVRVYGEALDHLIKFAEETLNMHDFVDGISEATGVMVKAKIVGTVEKIG